MQKKTASSKKHMDVNSAGFEIFFLKLPVKMFYKEVKSI